MWVSPLACARAGPAECVHGVCCGCTTSVPKLCPGMHSPRLDRLGACVTLGTPPTDIRHDTHLHTTTHLHPPTHERNRPTLFNVRNATQHRSTCTAQSNTVQPTPRGNTTPSQPTQRNWPALLSAHRATGLHCSTYTGERTRCNGRTWCVCCGVSGTPDMYARPLSGRAPTHRYPHPPLPGNTMRARPHFRD